MAATIARAQGYKTDGTTQNKQLTRLGHGAALVRASTRQTFTTAYIRADGAGYIEVVRDGQVLHTFGFGPE